MALCCSSCKGPSFSAALFSADLCANQVMTVEAANCRADGRRLTGFERGTISAVVLFRVRRRISGNATLISDALDLELSKQEAESFLRIKQS